MTSSSIVTEAKERWIREIEEFMASTRELDALLKNFDNGETIDFCVWLGLPEEASEFCAWGLAVRDVLQHFGIRVITNYTAYHSRHHSKAEQRKADLIVMLAVTFDVTTESIEACKEFSSKMIVCCPNEQVGTYAHSTLSQTYQVAIIQFPLSSFEREGKSRLGTDVFRCAADHISTKRTEQAKQLRLRETVVVLVHGIMSRGLWQGVVKQEFNNAGFIVESTNSGWVDILLFLLPIPWLRQRPVAKVWRDLLSVRNEYPDMKISVLAHSFGSYIVGWLFKQQKNFNVECLVFCGSILPVDFPFEKFRGRYVRILNEVSCKDPWPALAASVTWGYGATGTFGFNRPGVRDRWHRNLDHGGFLTRQFCAEYWVPFFFDGTVTSVDEDAEKPPVWIRAISAFHIKYVVAGALVVLAAYLWGPPLVRYFF